jgi:hypothetical protein
MPHPDGDKHHYIPKFYLKQWAIHENQLCEYSKHHHVVRTRQKYPDATGYLRGLNTFNALPPEIADFLEKRFFQKADDRAAKALKLIMNGAAIDGPTKSAWSRFIMTLIYRTPEGMRLIRQRVTTIVPSSIDNLASKYDELRRPSDPPTFEEFRSTVPDERLLQSATQRLLTRIMDSSRVGSLLNSMIFAILSPNSRPYPLLTSDRPMTITNGFGQRRACVVMPISPTKIFVAARDRNQIDEIAANITTKMVNSTVAEQARDYVYGVDGTQLRFVANRLGRRIRWGPFE